jgi:hypothetical protein
VTCGLFCLYHFYFMFCYGLNPLSQDTNAFHTISNISRYNFTSATESIRLCITQQHNSTTAQQHNSTTAKWFQTKSMTSVATA